MTLRGALYDAAVRAGVPRVWRTLAPRGVTILTYHGFTNAADRRGVVDHQRMRLHVAAFRRHVEHLVSHYRVLSLSDLMSLYRAGSPPPKRGVVLTFDDGYRSCYTLAYPLLKEFRVPATFFLSTDFVFEKRPLWHDRVEYALDSTRETSIDVEFEGEVRRFATASVPDKLAALRVLYAGLKRIDQRARDHVVDEIERRAGARLELDARAPDVYAPVEIGELREMVRDGLVAAGCHTKTHAILSRCADDQLRTELVVSKKAIEAALSRDCALFCYPNGARRDFDVRTRAALVENGFSCALTTVPGRNGRDADPMELRRVSAPADPAEFSLAVSGVRAELARAYRLARRALDGSAESADR